MTAYVIVHIDVKDPTTYKEYIDLAPATVEACGGKYLARAGRTEVLEGEWVPRRLVILQFESIGRARAWLDSPEYKPVKRLRHAAAVSNMVTIEGPEQERHSDGVVKIMLDHVRPDPRLDFAMLVHFLGKVDQ